MQRYEDEIFILCTIDVCYVGINNGEAGEAGDTMVMVGDPTVLLIQADVYIFQVQCSATDLMISIQGEISWLNNVVGRELHHPLNTFEQCILIHISPSLPL